MTTPDARKKVAINTALGRLKGEREHDYRIIDRIMHDAARSEARRIWTEYVADKGLDTLEVGNGHGDAVMLAKNACANVLARIIKETLKSG